MSGLTYERFGEWLPGWMGGLMGGYTAAWMDGGGGAMDEWVLAWMGGCMSG